MKKIIAISGSHGCFGKNTPILMSDASIKNIQDVKVDDYVMGEDFSPRRVLKLWKGVEKLYLFKYYDGTSHIYNASHDLILDRVQRAPSSKYKVKQHYIKTPTFIKVKEFINISKQQQKLYFKFSRPPITGLNSIINPEIISPVELYYIKSRVKKITPLGKGTYYGFTIDGNNLFLHADGSVLKNCGKSTVAYSLCSFLKKLGKNVVVLNELARECPFDINQIAGDKTHIWLSCKQIVKELEYEDLYEYVITDRSILDAFAYGSLLDKDKNWSFKYLEKYLSEHIKEHYNKLYVLEPSAFNFNIVDGVRDNDEIFRKNVHKKLTTLLDRNNIEYKLIFNTVDIFTDFI